LSEGFRVTPGVTVTIAPSALGAGYCLVGRNPATAAELWFTNDGGAGGRVTDVKPANC
jgi:hypothetical protein